MTPEAAVQNLTRTTWINKVLDRAIIDKDSELGKELTDTLSQLAKWAQQTDRLPGGEQDEPLDLDAADWTLVAAMMAPAETRIVESVAQSLDLTHPGG